MTMPQPRVSVVIPTFNRARDLDRALASVIAQTCPDWEAVVVDNHSTDDTDGVVARFREARIRLLKIHNRGVIAASRNLGISQAIGEYVAFLDSDDWWSPRKLEESCLALDRGADVVYHDLFVVRHARQRVFLTRTRTRDLGRPVFDDLIDRGNALSNSSVVIRKNVLDAIGRLSEDATLISWEDYDAWLRVSRVTERFERIRTLGYYWLGGGNVSSPERTLSNLKRFAELYADAVAASDARSGLGWFHYALGRAHYALGAYGAARAHLIQLIHRRVPFGVALKGLITMLSMVVRRHRSLAG